MMGKRYAMFCWKHEHKGGWNDLVGLFQTRPEVADCAQEQLGFRDKGLFGHVIDLHTDSRIMEIVNGYWCVRAQTIIFAGPSKAKAETSNRKIYVPLDSLSGNLPDDFGQVIFWGANKQAVLLPFKLNYSLPSILAGDRIFMWGFVSTVAKIGDKTEYIPCTGTWNSYDETF